MRAETERRFLQMAMGSFCLVPLIAGASGMIEGPAMLRGVGPPVAIDLDSHYRYLSGLLFGIGIGFALCIRGIERHGATMRVLAAAVVLGGLARLIALASFGAPGGGHLFGLGMELGAVPLILLWHMRVVRRCREAGDCAPPSSTISP